MFSEIGLLREDNVWRMPNLVSRSFEGSELYRALLETSLLRGIMRIRQVKIIDSCVGMQFKFGL